MDIVSDEIKSVKDIIQVILKAKKTIRMYLPNNPIYAKTLDDVYSRFTDFFSMGDDLRLRIRQNELVYSNEQVYFNQDKEDNLALFFFKDGVREITFLKGLTKDEVIDFLKILSSDFDREIIDDDVVTLLWEKDFEHVKYIVDESFLIEDEDYEASMIKQVREKSATEDDILKAYRDGLTAEAEKTSVAVASLNDSDLQALAREIEKEYRSKIDRAIAVLFEVLYQAAEPPVFSEICGFLADAFKYCIEKADFLKASYMLDKVRDMIEKGHLSDDWAMPLKRVLSFAGSDTVINAAGEIIDSDVVLDEKDFMACIKHLDKFAIPSLMRLLGELRSIRGRRLAIEALCHVGRYDTRAIARGLQDQRWYVVRNTIYILGRISDKTSIEYLSKVITHPDQRVRKETIKALGSLAGSQGLPYLKTALFDSEPSVRTAAVKVIGNIKTDAAKRILMDVITSDEFLNRGFDEKKEFYEVLASWADSEVADFLTNTLKKKRFFFGRSKNSELRACAAYALGLMGCKDAIPILEKTKNSGNRLLRDMSIEALKRLM